MGRIVAMGFGVSAGIVTLALAAHYAVEMGLLAAAAVGLVVGIAVRAGWRWTGRILWDRPPEDPVASPVEEVGVAPPEGGRETAPPEGEMGTAPPESESEATSIDRPQAPPGPREPFRQTETTVRESPAARPRARWPRVGALLLGGVVFAVVAALGVSTLLRVASDEMIGVPAPPPAPPGIAAVYTATVEPGDERNELRIRERYAVAISEIEDSPDLADPEAFRPQEGVFPVPSGWEGSLARDSVSLTRSRVEDLSVSLTSRTSVVRLEVPRVEYDGPVLWARPGSRIDLDLPRHFVAATFPPAESTVDLLDPRGLERTRVPVTVAAGDDREVRIQVLHPALRNPVGESLTQASLLAPVKWAVLALVAIFAEQIKARLLLPLARTLAGTFRLPLFEEEKAGSP